MNDAMAYANKSFSTRSNAHAGRFNRSFGRENEKGGERSDRWRACSAHTHQALGDFSKRFHRTKAAIRRRTRTGKRERKERRRKIWRRRHGRPSSTPAEPAARSLVAVKINQKGGGGKRGGRFCGRAQAYALDYTRKSRAVIEKERGTFYLTS